MSRSRRLTETELLQVQNIVRTQYTGRKVVKIVAELRQRRPVEEGLDIVQVGMALLIENGEVDLYFRVIADEFDCFMDTYKNLNDVDSGWILIVTVLEKK